MIAGDIRLGRYQTALSDVSTVDALITDPPYGPRTHGGYNAGIEQMAAVTGQASRRKISYPHWEPADVLEFVEFWAPRVRGWICAMTSHDLIPAWESALESCGRYVFAPVPVLMHTPRLLGDGPCGFGVWLVVARPRTAEFSRWGCLPGWYQSAPERGSAVVGAKPLALMRSIVRDYTCAGDVVCDPCAGGGTTLIAARAEGRGWIGAEATPDTWEFARARLAGDVPHVAGQLGLW